MTLDSRAIGDEQIKRERADREGREQRRALAASLVGKHVIFAHERGDMFAQNKRVECSTPDGMVCLEGWSGEFAADLFIVV